MGTRTTRRVVVAGMGAVSSQGASVADLWNGVKAGRVCIGPIHRMPTEGYRSHIGGEAPYPLNLSHNYRRPGGCRDPLIDFALKAAEDAIAGSGIDFVTVPPERWGVALGNSTGAFESLRAWYIANILGTGSDAGRLLLGPAQLVVETVGSTLGLRGPMLSVTNSCAAGATAIGLAWDMIRDGRADVMLAGGAESLTDLVYGAFHAIEALSAQPATPYSAQRQGLSLGEGSGLLLLVADDVARLAGAPVLAEVLGYGLSADGYDATAPEPSGAGMSRAMTSALRVSGLRQDDVDYVNGHGTGTPKNDPAETRAIHLALGRHALHVPVSSTKSMIGHLLGAAGGVEAVVTVRALQEQIAPPTAGYRARDDECDLDYVPNIARPARIEVALSNNFAFGGANATVALAAYRPERSPAAMTHHRVVITGAAALLPAGASIEALWQRVQAADAGARAPSQRLDLDAAPYLTPRDCRRMDRLGVLSVVAASRALECAGISITEDNREQIGIMFGTGIGPMETAERFWKPLYEEGPFAANPALSPNLVHNAAPGQVAMRTGAVGPTATLTGGHAAGALALLSGTSLVAGDRADAMVCMSADTLTDAVEKAYRDLGLLSEGKGFSLVEGGVAVVVEGLERARARKAPLLGEIIGFGVQCDAVAPGKSDPRGSGLERAMRSALTEAGLEPCDIEIVWANRAGFRPADVAERAAIRRVFGRHANVVAPRAVLGEPLGSGGLLSVALALESWRQQSGGRARRRALIGSSSLSGTHVAIVLESLES